MVLFWTLQKEEAWVIFQELGYLEGSSEHAAFPEEYLWMMEQMRKRLPLYNGEYPIWLWLKKPDMRSVSHFSSYTRCVRITVELLAKDVLVSDFEDWHMVLNDGFNSDNEQEYEEYYAGNLDITKEESWERIFELDRPRDLDWCGKSDWLQGVTGRISLDRVRNVEHFVSRKHGKI